jgi:hypothetical protein
VKKDWACCQSRDGSTRGYVERLVGTTRREVVDYLIVLSGLHHRYVRHAA